MTGEITEEEAANILRQMNEGKTSVHTFLQTVASTKDSTRVANLKEEELAIAFLPVRSALELGLFCEYVADDDYTAEYFKRQAEITNSTSLSREGFLIKAAITTKKELADMTPKKKKNRGWFKDKETTPNQNQNTTI